MKVSGSMSTQPDTVTILAAEIIALRPTGKQ